MASTLTKSQRSKIEAYIIGFFDTLDRSGTNSKYYKELMAGMSDTQFLK